MAEEDCATPVVSDSTAPSGWHNLAKKGEPNMLCKISDVAPYYRSATIIRILTPPALHETPRTKTKWSMTKRVLEEVVHDLSSSRLDKNFIITHLPELEDFMPWHDFDEDELKTVLHSRAGGAHHSHNELKGELSAASFIFVSPNDDWPYICFVAALSSLETTLIFASDDGIDVDSTGTAIVLQYLNRHVIRVTDELDSLALILEDVERLVQEITDATSLAEPIKQLHLCNIRHVRLLRRWTFQKQLMCTVDEIVTSRTYIVLLGITDSRDVGKMRQQLSYLRRLVEAVQTDLEVLPRRIENQFTALYNLSNQRDARASVQIAAESTRIARATLNDSSSMKTIAVMTLIFLPATFACSFFSMTFFNWQTANDRTVSKCLWIYFAVAIPITIMVLAAWAVLTKKNRQENSDRVGITQMLRRRTMERGHDLEKND